MCQHVYNDTNIFKSDICTKCNRIKNNVMIVSSKSLKPKNDLTVMNNTIAFYYNLDTSELITKALTTNVKSFDFTYKLFGFVYIKLLDIQGINEYTLMNVFYSTHKPFNLTETKLKRIISILDENHQQSKFNLLDYIQAWLSYLEINLFNDINLYNFSIYFLKNFIYNDQNDEIKYIPLQNYEKISLIIIYNYLRIMSDSNKHKGWCKSKIDLIKDYKFYSIPLLNSIITKKEIGNLKKMYTL